MKIPGDVDSDGAVVILDLAALGLTYGSTPGSPNWNFDSDFNTDSIISVVDLATLGRNYGKTV